MILYKYATRDGMKKIVTGSSLLARPLNEFNDPFESVPVVTEDVALLIAARTLDDSKAIRLLSTDPEINSEGLTVPQLRLRLEDLSFKNTVIETLVRRSKAAPLEFALSFQNFFGSLFGLVCLTSTSSNILMWSHYAEEHRGFVFSIETSLWDPARSRKSTTIAIVHLSHLANQRKPKSKRL